MKSSRHLCLDEQDRRSCDAMSVELKTLSPERRATLYPKDLSKSERSIVEARKSNALQDPVRRYRVGRGCIVRAEAGNDAILTAMALLKVAVTSVALPLTFSARTDLCAPRVAIPFGRSCDAVIRIPPAIRQGNCSRVGPNHIGYRQITRNICIGESTAVRGARDLVFRGLDECPERTTARRRSEPGAATERRIISSLPTCLLAVRS
jgi:hypothetical protein